MDINLVVESAGERLDALLHRRFPLFSRTLIQKTIKRGAVTVNGTRVAPHYAVKLGDLIKGTIQPLPKPDLSPDPAIVWETIFETPTYLVVNKPAGLVVHPSESSSFGTLVNGLLAHYPAMAKVGEDPLRPGIVHRLDKEASGLMVVALTQSAFDHFKREFQAHRIRKEYLALVYGTDLPDSGEISFALKRSKEGKMVSIPETISQPARTARTSFEVLRKFLHFTLVRVSTHTGRTHQIRAHFHGLGHPLVGDSIYWVLRYRHLKRWDHLFLCADRLAFTDPEGNFKEFSISLPTQLQAILDELEKH